MAAPVFRGTATNDFSTTSGTLPVPVGVQDGDWLLGWAATDVTHTVSNHPTGWTFQWTVDAGSLDSSTSVWTKVWHSGDTTGYTFTLSATGGAASVYAASGGTTINVGTHTTRSSAATVVTPQITPTVDNCLILAFAGEDPASNAMTAHTAGAWTERIDHNQAAALGWTYLMEQTQTTAAPTSGSIVHSAANPSSVHIIALQGLSFTNFYPPTVNMAPYTPY